MEKFLSCDWGTSSLRLRLVTVPDKQVLSEINTSQGISGVYQLWKQSGKQESERLSFYLDIISGNIQTIEKNTGISLANIPMIISGMASSSIGMTELPYKNIPFLIDGSDLELHRMNATAAFPHPVCIISGIRTENDVMRGEETQLVGCIQQAPDNGASLYIFPGTHSKHVMVKGNQAIDFKTYMTGELFELLSEKSVLSVSLEKSGQFEQPVNQQSFEQGVKEGATSNILHSCFHVRTNSLFNKLSKQENYFYLSGLLIGAELKDLLPFQQTKIIVVGTEFLSGLYSLAICVLGDAATIKPEPVKPGEAIINGHLHIYKTAHTFPENLY